MKMTPGYHVERRGRFLVAVSDSPTATLTREMVEETREAIRRERAGPLPAYVDELEWRFSGGNNPYMFCDRLALVTSTNPTYQGLVPYSRSR